MHRFALPLIVCSIICSPLAAEDHGLKVPPGFKVTLWADHELANDIYAMTLDEKGRVVVTSRGWVKRLTDTDGDGKADKASIILTTATGGMGLWCDRMTLHLCADGKYAVYRAESGTDFARPMETYAALRFGEHGGHAMRKGPDGCWYVIAGNDAELGKVKLDPSSPIHKPEAGGILRFSKDMKKVECVAHGFRNPYDFDFTPLGDIIAYDSDTERDFLLPWYTPTRMYHVAHGQHHGWRLPGYLQSLARRDYYPDTVSILAPIGRGSPTGVVCYRHYQFPKRYRGGVFALDWTFGKVWFVPLDPDGSSYKTKPEVFIEPVGGNGFAPTDACVAPDGSLFISIGGRGTRGAVYRVEYVGTKEQPREEWKEPERDIDKVLDAPQPLDAWSRAKWEPIVRREKTRYPLPILNPVILDEKQSISRRIRAIEIRNDLFSGLSAEVAEAAAKSHSWEVRSRVAWSLGRDLPKGGEAVLLGLAKDPHPKVRVEALGALGDLLGTGRLKDQQEAFLPVVADNLGQADKRVRLAASRLTSVVDGTYWVKLGAVLDEAPLRARLTFALTDHSHGVPPTLFASKKHRTALAGLKSLETQLRLDALRLLMLIRGDWCLNNPPAAVYSAYALQRPPKEWYEAEKEAHGQIRKLYPTGDRNFDHEAARYLAMIEDDEPETVTKILTRITKDSPATDDVHHLIVLSRLRGKRTPEQTSTVADALLGLEKKWQGYQLRIKQTWAPRLAEVVANLVKQHPALPAALMKDPRFVQPSFVVLAEVFGPDDRQKAARQFLDAVKKDGDFVWSPELVDLLAALPPAEHRPVFRKQWSDYSLRDAILQHLLVKPDAGDRQRFLDGLDLPQTGIVLASITALQRLPRDANAANLAPILRRLRLSLQEPKDKDIRGKLLALFNYEAGTNFRIDVNTSDPLKLTEAFDLVFVWFERRHPTPAKLLRGDEDDPRLWSARLATVLWEKGDAERGLKIFRERSCMACHSGPSRIGPDLMGVAGRFSRDDLFTAIIFPNRDVAPAFRVNDIETLAGKRLSGIVVFESADGVIVQVEATKTVRIDAADIASRKPSPKSLMPAGLLKDLKPDDLADLYAYLKSLKLGP